MCGKHAYLIVAHKDRVQLTLLLKELDYEMNDIFLLVDERSDINSFEYETKYSKIKYIKGESVFWGDYSQIRALHKLIRKSREVQSYYYYHFISGSDFPLASQQNIHGFFELNPNKIFLTYSDKVSKKDLQLRTYTYSFCNIFRPKNIFAKVFFKFYRWIERKVICIWSVPRMKIAEIEYGSNWASFDSDFCEEILKSEQWAKSKFRNGYLVDELYLQSLVKKKKLESKVYHITPVTDQPYEFQGNLRYINWWSGNPYTWKGKDIEELLAAKKTGHLFTRKLDSFTSKDLPSLLNKHNKKD